MVIMTISAEEENDDDNDHHNDHFNHDKKGGMVNQLNTFLLLPH